MTALTDPPIEAPAEPFEDQDGILQRLIGRTDPERVLSDIRPGGFVGWDVLVDADDMFETRGKLDDKVNREFEVRVTGR